MEYDTYGLGFCQNYQCPTGYNTLYWDQLYAADKTVFEGIQTKIMENDNTTDTVEKDSIKYVGNCTRCITGCTNCTDGWALGYNTGICS